MLNKAYERIFECDTKFERKNKGICGVVSAMLFHLPSSPTIPEKNQKRLFSRSNAAGP
jgi:hypothetical protein